MYKRIMEIARKNMLEYVHETYLRRFVQDIAEECAMQCQANGYDDAAEVIRDKFKFDAD